MGKNKISTNSRDSNWAKIQKGDLSVKVFNILGKPSLIERLPDKKEIWTYDDEAGTGKTIVFEEGFLKELKTDEERMNIFYKSCDELQSHFEFSHKKISEEMTQKLLKEIYLLENDTTDILHECINKLKKWKTLKNSHDQNEVVKILGSPSFINAMSGNFKDIQFFYSWSVGHKLLMTLIIDFRNGLLSKTEVGCLPVMLPVSQY